eukprot:CAMPEP_0204833448 /NCGR_PEP_ID=MMETSP1346-20131115/16862_1 /ASSEMBLY_ACC=CAM_ASM_000771 /TAXON_ID=215587 /ORGANISM="Aplanochytrium stocchinoi, Strain GSBS06" /LENGTH=249 /DNA_ID=CAMNT_0051965993 /DNA_START=291 /DNA_END=1040 /DNA_ORIENTATION=-
MSDRVLEVHFLPELTTEKALENSIVVIIDILRASTTITYALAAGAKCIYPFLTINEVVSWKKENIDTFTEGIILGGERGGKIIEGFDLGNSPSVYTEDEVRGKVIGFTTSNGTKAMQSAVHAKRVLIGCFSNISAVLDDLNKERAPIHLLCAGTNGVVTREDVLFAGKVVHSLANSDSNFCLNDEAIMASAVYAQTLVKQTTLDSELRNTLGGRGLTKLGYEDDIELVSKEDVFSILPTLDTKTWSIRR